ncbi:ABC transporter B family member 26, chloroplastic-like isoform X1 [Coffea eugenioides]|uniref:ABC transporter B family member 26, chloroplastic-like isoform X1 n=1 Tax=Coffea eugenioides TaxID=49369 RepID=UPI000F611E61|nr:ABC transporter B family member 26, chloroplastic-like isoform X1 [Coffea eugenioides]
MAICLTSPRTHSSPEFGKLRSTNITIRKLHLNLAFNSKLRFPYSISVPNVQSRKYSHFSESSSVKGGGVSPEAYQDDDDDGLQIGDSNFDKLKEWVNIVRPFIPGGSWWNLYNAEGKQDGSPTSANPVSLPYALARMWTLVADQRWVLCTAFAALAIAAVAEISIPSILAASIFAAHSGNRDVFLGNSKLLVFLCFTSGICSGLRSGCFAVANTVLVKRMRKTLYSILLDQDFSFFRTEAVGDLTSRLGTDCQRLSHTFGGNLHLIVRNLLQGTGAFIYLVTLSWPLALSTMVICSLLSVIFLFYGRYQKKAAKLSQDYTASANEVATETLSLIRAVRAYGTERQEVERFVQQLENIAFVGIRESAANGFWSMSFHSLYRFTQVLAVLLGGMSILTGHVSAELLTKYVFYCEWLIYAAWRVQDNLSSLLQSVGACEKIFLLMNLSSNDQLSSKGVKLSKLRGDIDFVNVSFHYPSQNMVPVLENMNFSIRANETTAIVGVSGSGKSTLINLLLRLYEQTDGQIFIDHFSHRELDIRWLRGKIGFVGQDPHLFNMDIKSNICYGCNRNIRQEDIEWAAKQAYAHNFISSLPNGYGTIINDNLLSRGQKQRIALARAILRDPEILVLDEATSALDAESEYYIKCFLQSFKIKTKRTVIVIAQRMSTLEAADNILVIDGGQIVEHGKHSDLLRKDGLYARLWRIQANAWA